MANPAVITNRGMFMALDGSNLGTLPVDARLSISALISDDGSAPLAVRQGIFFDGGAAAVTGTTDTGTMTYQIRACSLAFYLLGTIASGTVLLSINGNLKVDTTTAPGSNSRIDVIWVRQRVTAADGGSDSVNTPILGCTQGTPAASPTVPAIPTGAYAIAQAVVTAGTTQTSTTTITQVFNWTCAAGSPIPVRNSTEKAALTPYLGMSIYRLDLHSTEVYNGTTWSAPTSIRYDSTSATVTVTPLNTTVPVTNWLTNTHNLGDIGYAAGVFTAATAGVYRWEATVQWPTLGTTFRVEQFILVNGVASAAGQQSINFPAASGAQYITTGFTVQLNAGDTLQLGLQATTSGVTGVQPMAFSMTRVA